MNLVIYYWPTEQLKVVSKTGENCKLLDKCILNNVSQLGLVVSHSTACHYWLDGCATDCLPVTL